MAGDWIKMRSDLASDPAVIGIAHSTGLEEDHVVGKLHRLWAWADAQSRDGNASHVTVAWIDRYLSTEGFAAAMVAVGWLVVRNEGVCFPRFDRHNSQTAKKRLLSAQRTANHRAKKCNAVSVTEVLPREEKRREEKTGAAPALTPDKSAQRGRASDALDPEFDRFWRAYPKKEAQAKAREAWDLLSPDAELVAAILAAIEWQRKSGCLHQEPRYVPQAGTWLTDRRWRDEKPTEPAAQRQAEEKQHSQAVLAKLRQEREQKRVERLESDGQQAT